MHTSGPLHLAGCAPHDMSSKDLAWPSAARTGEVCFISIDFGMMSFDCIELMRQFSETRSIGVSAPPSIVLFWPRDPYTLA